MGTVGQKAESGFQSWFLSQCSAVILLKTSSYHVPCSQNSASLIGAGRSPEGGRGAFTEMGVIPQGSSRKRSASVLRGTLPSHYVTAFISGILTWGGLQPSQSHLAVSQSPGHCCRHGESCQELALLAFLWISRCAIVPK